MKLHYEINPFRGAEIESILADPDPSRFSRQLAETLEAVRSEELDLAWLILPMALSALVPAAVQMGFIYHHADGQGLQLVCRIQPGAHIPEYATHYIGAGGVIIDPKDRILIIQERFHRRKHYKLPGGAIDPGEHISDGVRREVLEETGIETEFLSLNCFRHWHGYRYGKSDIYFVCRLKPLTFAISIDPREIANARWIPVSEYLDDPDTHPFNRKIVQTALTTRGLQLDQIRDYGTPATHEMMF